MHVSLPPELERRIHEKVKAGLYPSANEVVREALQLLEERDRLQAVKLEELRRLIRVGVDQADRGELLDGPEVFRELRRKIGDRQGPGVK